MSEERSKSKEGRRWICKGDNRGVLKATELHRSLRVEEHEVITHATGERND